jgi:putative transcriptional regulator
MPVRITLDDVLADRGLTAKELGRAIGMSETQLSLFRSGKVRGIRFSSLAAICAVLECRPGDLLDYDLNPADVRTQSGDDTAAIT